MTENQEEKILKKLREKGVVPHKIAKATGLSDSTIKNYIVGATKPTPANLKILEKYFQNSNIDNSNIGNIDDSKISTDVLKSEITRLNVIITEKENQVSTLINQVTNLTNSLSKKDDQISKLIDKIK